MTNGHEYISQVANSGSYLVIAHGDEESMGITWDQRVGGLGKRKGKRDCVWILKYRFDGIQRVSTIGPVATLPIDAARGIAKMWKYQAKQGIDPEPARKERKLHTKITMADFAPIYLEQYAKPRKKSWEEDQRRLKLYILPNFGVMQLHTIKRSQVAALHSRLGAEYPYVANRLREQLHVMFNFASELGYLPESHPNPAAGIRDFKEKSRERYLDETEMERLLNAVEKECFSEHHRVFFYLKVLTGLRKCEILGLRWDRIDFEKRQVIIENTKNGKAHYHPLSEAAVDLLKQLERRHDIWVFPARHGSTAMGKEGVEKAWNRVRKEANLPDVRLHDLRRTAASWMAQAGVHPQLISEMLNHSNPAITRIYTRFGRSDARDVMENYSKAIAKVSANFMSRAEALENLS